jgi:hypothetical protein
VRLRIKSDEDEGWEIGQERRRERSSTRKKKQKEHIKYKIRERKCHIGIN